MRDKLDTMVLITTLAAVLLAVWGTGQRDYADAIERERAVLRMQLKMCRAGLDTPPAQAMPSLHQNRAEVR